MSVELGERIFVALSNSGHWGKAFSVTGAKRAAAPGGFWYPYSWVVHMLPDGAYDVWVDGMGSIHWTFREGADTNAQSEIVEKSEAYVEAGYESAEIRNIALDIDIGVPRPEWEADLTVWISPDGDDYVLDGEVY